MVLNTTKENKDLKKLIFLICHSELAKNLMLLRQKLIIQILRKLRMTNLKCSYQTIAYLLLV